MVGLILQGILGFVCLILQLILYLIGLVLGLLFGVIDQLLSSDLEQHDFKTGADRDKVGFRFRSKTQNTIEAFHVSIVIDRILDLLLSGVEVFQDIADRLAHL